MTVKELIEELQGQDPDANVRIEQPTHDHWNNLLAAEIQTLEVVNVKHSAYHDADVVADDEDAGNDDVEDVVLLS